MNERRLARLQEQIKQRLAEVLLRDIADPKLGMVTITRIELDSEFTQCKAYWSAIGTDQQVKQSGRTLQRARGLCQRAIASAIHTRSVPHLSFIYDAGIAEAVRLNTLMDDLREEREARERDQAPPPEGEATPDAPDSPPVSGPE